MADLSATQHKQLRKGTKSCTECRSRKIRCTWEAESDQVCTNCKTRHRQCVPQLYQRRSKPSDSLRADRIERLEKQIASIAAAVQEKGRPPLSSNADLSPAIEDVTENHPMEGPASTPPTHLKFLFDNSLIAPSGQGAESDDVTRSPCSLRYLEQARAKLQHFLPAKADVQLAAGYGTGWMRLHRSLFTSVLQFGSEDELIHQYDEQHSPIAQPVDIASYLLVFAITVRQILPGQQGLTFRDIPKYVQDVLNVVETTIISHTGIVSTVEGLSTAVLYMRLQLGVGQIRPLWLTLRRTIAIAELTNLPRIWNTNHFESQHSNGSHIARDPRNAEKVALWEAICATDRLSSMMFNLPAATATFSFPKRDLVSPSGKVMSQPYLLELAGIAMRVQQLDETYTLGRDKSESYEKVLGIDKDIRSLKSSTPSSWWVDDAADFSGDRLVQFWHYYLLVRAHLHSAMSADDHDHYEYSRTVCVEACKTLAYRYGLVRRHLPPGFFVCRIIDMQIFTAAVFMILSYGQTIDQDCKHGSSCSTSQSELQLSAVKHILTTMEFASGQISGDFAQEATAAIRSLMTLSENPAVAGSQGLTLRIPLLGKIHITAKNQVPDPLPQQLDADLHQRFLLPDGESDTRTEAVGAELRDGINSFNALPDSLPWYMELDVDSSSLQDPYITSELGNWDQWMDAGGLQYPV